MAEFHLMHTGGQLDLPVVAATDGPSGVEIGSMLKETGYTTLDSGSPIAAHQHKHGDGVRVIALSVPSVDNAYREATTRGAVSVDAPDTIRPLVTSCSAVPRSSRLAQCSITWPSAIRSQCVCVLANVLPVGGNAWPTLASSS